MHELMLLLTMFTAETHRKPVPALPAAVELQATPAKRTLSAEERLALREAVYALSAAATSEVRYDAATGFYLPVTGSAGESPARLAAKPEQQRSRTVEPPEAGAASKPAATRELPREPRWAGWHMYPGLVHTSPPPR